MLNSISMNVKTRIKNNKNKLKIKNSIKIQYINMIHTYNKIYMCINKIYKYIVFTTYFYYFYIYVELLENLSIKNIHLTF